MNFTCGPVFTEDVIDILNSSPWWANAKEPIGRWVQAAPGRLLHVSRRSDSLKRMPPPPPDDVGFLPTGQTRVSRTVCDWYLRWRDPISRKSWKLESLNTELLISQGICHLEPGVASFRRVAWHTSHPSEPDKKPVSGQRG